MFNNKSISTFVALAVLSFALFAPASAAYAQKGTPQGGPNAPQTTTDTPKGTPQPKGTPGADDKGNSGDKGNSNIKNRLEKVLNGQKVQLERADKVIEKTQAWIDEMKAAGKDVSEITTAFVAFKAEIAKAQASYDATKKSLEGLSFDANGQPTDREAWRKAFTTIMKSNGDFISSIEKAIRDFQKVVRATQQKNRASATPKP